MHMYTYTHTYIHTHRPDTQQWVLLEHCAASDKATSLCTLLSGSSVPVLKVHIPPGPSEEPIQQLRSRSQSLDRKSSETLGGSRKRCRHPSVTQPLSPSHSSPQKSLSESPSFHGVSCLSVSVFLHLSICLSPHPSVIQPLSPLHSSEKPQWVSFILWGFLSVCQCLSVSLSVSTSFWCPAIEPIALLPSGKASVSRLHFIEFVVYHCLSVCLSVFLHIFLMSSHWAHCTPPFGKSLGEPPSFHRVCCLSLSVCLSPHPSVIQPLSPLHSSLQKSLSESPSFYAVSCLSVSVCLSICLRLSVRLHIHLSSSH